tara:strand:+ start:389 stop:703 length:315 start_codon:yes stop_codon:yes gene_type:complete
MRSKKVGILNTFLCLCLLIFVLVFIQMNNQIRESVDDDTDDDTTVDGSDNIPGVSMYQDFACSDFNLTPNGFSCARVVMLDATSKYDPSSNSDDEYSDDDESSD